MFQQNDRLLLIGDSITDCGWREDPEALGDGYVRMISERVAAHVINKGIGGNRVTDLAARWEEDVLSENPAYVSVSIGINDVWRQLDAPDIEQVDPAQFERMYRGLLEQLDPDVTVILMEPTVIEEDPQSAGNQLLRDYVAVVRKLAAEKNAILVPLHDVFIEAVRSGQGPLTTDGVHMTESGNRLMTNTWLKTVEAALQKAEV